MLSETQLEKPKRFSYRFRLEPKQNGRMEAPPLSAEELQAYINDLLGIKKASGDGPNQKAA